MQLKDEKDKHMGETQKDGAISFSHVRMRRGKRAEEFFRLTDEARSSLLECHCKVQGIYVPFREPTSTSTHVQRAAPCRLHLHLRPRTRTRFVLIYVDEPTRRSGIHVYIHIRSSRSKVFVRAARLIKYQE